MKTILLIEDDDDLLKSLAEILRRFGYHVVAMSDAESALAHIRGGAAIDLVVTDDRMPGMHGSEFVTVFRKAKPAVPVIMLTGYGGVESYLRSISNGVFEYINKPVLAIELQRIVQAALAWSADNRPAAP